MEIILNTEYCIGNNIYKLEEDSTISTFKVVDIELEYKCEANKLSITYVLKKFPNGCNSFKIMEYALKNKGYFKSKMDILKHIADQL